MKQQQLVSLARLRQRNVPKGYKGIADFHHGAYECDFVSPYTKSAGNINAYVMFILQDWSSDEFLSKPLHQDVVRLGHSPELPTNKNLKHLLGAHFGLLLSDTYGTNLFPFVKPGGISASIPSRDLIAAARAFAIPQIEIVSPKLVICLGLPVYNSIRRAIGMKPKSNLSAAIENPFAMSGAAVWAQSHPGGLGRAGRNHGGVDRVSEDWQKMAMTLQAARTLDR